MCLPVHRRVIEPSQSDNTTLCSSAVSLLNLQPPNKRWSKALSHRMSRQQKCHCRTQIWQVRLSETPEITMLTLTCPARLYRMYHLLIFTYQSEQCYNGLENDPISAHHLWSIKDAIHSPAPLWLRPQVDPAIDYSRGPTQCTTDLSFFSSVTSLSDGVNPGICRSTCWPYSICMFIGDSYNGANLIWVPHQIASFKTALHSLAAAVADPSPLMSLAVGSNH